MNRMVVKKKLAKKLKKQKDRHEAKVRLKNEKDLQEFNEFVDELKKCFWA